MMSVTEMEAKVTFVMVFVLQQENSRHESAFNQVTSNSLQFKNLAEENLMNCIQFAYFYLQKIDLVI